MKPLATLAAAIVMAVTFQAAPASAQQPPAGAPAPPLHVDKAYRSCFFDLHPELTQAQFQEFTAELGSVLRFRPLGDIAPLGRGHVAIGVQYASSRIDETKGAWNNTMSHPSATHGLGSSIAFPRIVARVGVSDRADLGAWGGFDPHANYGIVGVDTTVALMRQGPSWPVTVAIRPSLTSLVGPDEVWVGNSSVDLSVSRAMGPWAPYAGIGASSSLGVERSVDVDLQAASAGATLSYAGISYRWRTLVLAAEAEKGRLTSYGFRIGTRF